MVCATISSTILEICPADARHWSDSLRISSATTANPLPASPALAASIDALRDKRLVCSAISLIAETMLLMDLDLFSNSSIELITFLVISAVDSALLVSPCTELIPELIVVPVALVSFSISSALELTLLILPDSISIWFRQSPDPVSSLLTPISISDTAF